MNVFHAGDGNLHPLIAFDRRDAEQVERVHAAGKEIIEACVAVGGVLSGEHGIGLEKRDFMPLTFPRWTSTPRPAPARPSTPGAAQPRQGAAHRQPLRRAHAGRRVAAARHLAVTAVLSPSTPQEAAAALAEAGRARATVAVVGGGTRSRRGRPGPRRGPRAAHGRPAPAWWPTSRPTSR